MMYLSRLFSGARIEEGDRFYAGTLRENLAVRYNWLRLTIREQL